MNTEHLLLLGIVGILLLFHRIILRLTLHRRPSVTFPAPWGLSGLGHILFLGKDPSKTFLEWKGKYGNVFELNFVGKRVLVLNDRRSIKECFSMPEFSGKKDAIPMFKWWGERSGPGLFFNEGPHVEELRNFFLKSFRDFGITRQSKMEGSYRVEILALLDRWDSLSSKYFDLNGAFNQTVLNSVWSVLASKRYEFEETVPMISYIETMMRADTAATQLSLVAPWLMNKFSNVVKLKLNANEDATNTIKRFVEQRKQVYSEGQSRDIIDSFFDKVETTTDPSSAFHKSEESIAPALRDVLYGAIETVAKSLEFFVMYGVLYPRVIQKLQAEIDLVVGRSRLPSLNDKKTMPYATSCVMELLRKATITPLASPHCATTDTEFRGVPVQKGTLVLGNLYAVHHDPTVWDDPEEFKPERFLGHDGTVLPEGWSKIAPFSLGKRACIGSGVVSDQLFMVITSVYQKFVVETESALSSVEGLFGITYKPISGIKINAKPRG